jgi:hypothetical protein
MAQLDPDPYRRGKQFEHICKWFLTHDPVYRHELRQVWLWDGWPGRWGIDAGIDLVAEDCRGQLWAIQAKAYGADQTVTKQDVDSFLSESGRPEFSFRLLIATTNHIGSNAKRTIDKQEKPASVLDLGQLEAAQVDWLEVRPRHPRNHMKLLAAVNRRVARIEKTVSPYCHVSFIPASDYTKHGPLSEVFVEHGESVPFNMPMLVQGIDVSYVMQQFMQDIQPGAHPLSSLSLDEVNKHLKRRQ